MNLAGIVKQLKQERDRVQQRLSGLNAALEAFANAYKGGSEGRAPRRLATKGHKARPAKAQDQARVAGSKRGKRTVSTATRRKIALAQKARWAKAKEQKKA